MDNHISHMGYSVCVFAKENGIILQTLPPHTSHASQPLDRTIYGPFKCHLAESHANWLREHPGQRVSMYEVPLLSKPAIQRAFSESNIKKGFQATGLYPLNPNAIPIGMFAASAVTDLPGMHIVYLLFIYLLYHLFNFILKRASRQNGLTLASVVHHLPIQG